MKKTLILILTLVLIGLGIFTYTRNDQPESQIEKQPDMSVEIIEVEAPEATLDTSDWKEFRSEKFGISFKTPADWNNREGEDWIGLDYNPYDSLGSIRMSGFETEDEMIDFLVKDGLSSILFLNKHGIKIYSTGTVYYALVRDNIYQITGLPDVIPTIITTLQLTEE